MPKRDHLTLELEPVGLLSWTAPEADEASVAKLLVALREATAGTAELASELDAFLSDGISPLAAGALGRLLARELMRLKRSGEAAAACLWLAWHHARKLRLLTGGISIDGSEFAAALDLTSLTAKLVTELKAAELADSLDSARAQLMARAAEQVLLCTFVGGPDLARWDDRALRAADRVREAHAPMLSFQEARQKQSQAQGEAAPHPAPMELPARTEPAKRGMPDAFGDGFDDNNPFALSPSAMDPPKLTVAPDAAAAVARLARETRSRLSGLSRLSAPVPLPLLRPDFEVRLDALLTEAPNLAGAVSHIRRELRLRQVAGNVIAAFRPLLLVGPPGVGKTRIARRIAEAIGLAFASWNVGGASDNRGLEGTSSGWSTAEACWPVRELHRCGMSGALLLVDELDKAARDSRYGTAADTLLAWTDPRQARDARDPVLGPVDLSGISWMLCVNDLSNVPGPLRSRCRAIEVAPPPASAFRSILAGILRDTAEELGCAPQLLPQIGETELRWLERRWGRSPRLLRKLTEAVLGMSAIAPTIVH